jgi:hypothetical protein
MEGEARRGDSKNQGVFGQRRLHWFPNEAVRGIASLSSAVDQKLPAAPEPE